MYRADQKRNFNGNTEGYGTRILLPYLLYLIILI